uniref:RNase H type-1 domain-containing protein n=1 Tax=Tanacetum cinerariifolium TaxID=118510 RepID=A0A699HX68_TANCI|nr:hypothetical protein [Tanacetum cinerariifolium]
MRPKGTMLPWKNWPGHFYTCLGGYEGILRLTPIKVIKDQPLKRILNKAQALGKLAKYLVELGVYNITYAPRNVIKGQVLADFLSEAPVGTPTEEFFQLPPKVQNKDNVKKWTLFTDDASNCKRSRAGLVLISPSSVEFVYALRLNFTSTNNEAEYEALLAGLRIARKLKVHDIDVKVDSKLKTDILGKLATHAFDHLTKNPSRSIAQAIDQPKGGRFIVEEEEDNCMTPIIHCLAKGVWPEDKDERRALKMKLNQYVLEKGVLFKKGYLVPMLRCVGPLQANYVIREIHMGSCEMHIRARSVVSKAMTGILLANYAQIL